MVKVSKMLFGYRKLIPLEGKIKLKSRLFISVCEKNMNIFLFDLTTFLSQSIFFQEAFKNIDSIVSQTESFPPFLIFMYIWEKKYFELQFYFFAVQKLEKTLKLVIKILWNEVKT